MSDDNKPYPFDWNAPANHKVTFGRAFDSDVSKTVPKVVEEKWSKPVTPMDDQVDTVKKSNKEIEHGPAVYVAQETSVDVSKSMEYHRMMESAASKKKPVFGLQRFEEGVRQNNHLTDDRADNVVMGGTSQVGVKNDELERMGSHKTVIGKTVEEMKPTVADRTEKFTR